MATRDFHLDWSGAASQLFLIRVPVKAWDEVTVGAGEGRNL